MSSWLEQITTKAASRGTKTVISGGEGVGKTSTAAHFPDPIFIVAAGEDSLGTLQDAGEIPATNAFPPMNSWTDANQALEELLASDKAPGTLVLDALDGFEALAVEHVKNTKFDGDRLKFQSYGAGWGVVSDNWRTFLAILDGIAGQGTNLIILAHVEVKKMNSPDSIDYDRWQPAANKAVWALTSRWCDNILQLSCLQSIEETDGKAKARGTGDRIMYTSPNPARVCKNRHGMDDQYLLGGSPQAAAKVIADTLNL
jgi:hypothetical protein|tara:strand:- start:929 stop:1699 length:771 start_codon:yes stop_codon:yes gene_type:complete